MQLVITNKLTVYKMINPKPRVMWLLNHTSARKFDVAMLKTIGFNEIFLPKHYPQEASFRSASVDYSEDVHLSIPAEELEILNAADWYNGPDKATWAVANKYFDILFFIVHCPSILANISQNFNGIAILRAYGLNSPMTYDKVCHWLTNGLSTIETMGRRFWFGEAYAHLHRSEGTFFQAHSVFLPLGLQDCSSHNDQWNGNNQKIFFVCPDIGFNSYYLNIYQEFKTALGDMPYAIGGAQPVPVADPSVLGFVSSEQHASNMREFRVMFYHSTEPNHIHYHPFEAIRAGMPLVFMAGGLLDSQGGIGQPGRCKTIKEAHSKIHRILNDDWALIEDIRNSQVRLLDPMRSENCEPAWNEGFKRILDELEQAKVPRPAIISKPRKRIAVIVPIGYRGGSLRGAKMLAHALWEGSRQTGENADVVLAHLDDSAIYPDEEFDDLHPTISRRQFHWKSLNANAARRAMRYSGHSAWEPALDQHYCIPDDNIQQFLDCDLWVIVSDRLNAPLLPLRPYVCMVYDYLQRYETILPHGADQSFLNTARLAQQVLVTTNFTEQDALQYAGINPNKLARVPMLAPVLKPSPVLLQLEDVGTYFLWTTNAAPHKNHLNAILALKEYYEVLDGKLKCRVTGVDTKNMLKRGLTHLKPVSEVVAGSSALRSRVRWLGEVPDDTYQQQLAGAAFLWHAGHIDNGSFSVVEAAHLGVPALSSDYPAMREIDTQFQLNLTWMDASKPKLMAMQLKWIEENLLTAKTTLPSKKILEQQSVEKLALAYWKAVRECL
jgi:glycosyltransferase involved in cell wall biosynthesis